MIVDNAEQHRAMHKNSRIELKCATVTVEKESQVYGMLEKSRMELGSASISVDNDSKVCPMKKNIRIEVLKYPLLLLRVRGRSVKCINIAEWSLDVQ